MRSRIFLLLAVPAFVLCATAAFAQESASADSSAASTLDALQELIAKTKDDITKAEESVRSTRQLVDSKSGKEKEDAQKRLLVGQRDLTVLQGKLAALLEVEATLQDDDPIQFLLSELKREQDAIPTPGTESEQQRRVALDAQISALESANAARTPSSESSLVTLNNIGSTLLVIAVVVICLAGIVGIGAIASLLWQITSPSANQANDDTARVRLANVVTLCSILFIVVVAVVTLLFAGTYLAIPSSDTEKIQAFFDVSKWVFGAVLPVVGAWVGAVIAYYFGKDNFQAGAENVEKIARTLSPQEKLASHPASGAGLEISKAATLRLKPGEDIKTVDLNRLKAAYKPGTKTFDRLPILASDESPKACLHRSILTDYLNDLSDTDKTDRSKMTVSALMVKTGWEPDKSFNTLLSTETLSRAQALINDSKACSDVFVTSDGTRATPATRWITNVDILKIAVA